MAAANFILEVEPSAIAACSSSKHETMLPGKVEVAENHQIDSTDNHNAHDIDTNGSSAVANHVNGVEEAHEEEPAENCQGVIDISISNVVCSFSVRCHINLKRLAMEGSNVEYKRQHGICNMKLRRPNVTANITSSGKITVTGSTSEDEAKIAARRVARRLQKLGFNVRFFNFRVVNVLGTCSLPFGIKLNNFSREHPDKASYEPELHPGVTYRIKEPKATLKVFSTGSITVTAPCVNNVGLAVEHIYPLVSEFQMEKRETPAQIKKKMKLKDQQLHPPQHNGFYNDDDDDDDNFDDYSDLDSNEEEFDSDVSHD